MPNWVINRLTFTGKNAQNVIKQHLSKDETGKEYFDFNTIEKMPKDLQIEKSSKSCDGLKLYLGKINPLIPNLGKEEDKLSMEEFSKMVVGTFGNDAIRNMPSYIIRPSEIEALRGKYKDGFDEAIKLGKKQVENMQKYGSRDWYDWSCTHWGTKWNACETSVNDNTVYFDTAWSPSIEAIDKLAKMHPEIEIKHEYAEEQCGLMSGVNEYQNGEKVEENNYDSFSKEAFELHFDLWGGEDDYIFDVRNNTYKYKGDEQCEM